MTPNFGDRYGAEELIAPEDAVAEQGDGLPDVPPAVIVGFQPELTDAVEARAEDSVRIVRSQYLYQLTDQVGYVPVHEWGIGAPVAATVVENVIAAGAEAVVQLSGGAGSSRISTRRRPCCRRAASGTRASRTTTCPTGRR